MNLRETKGCGRERETVNIALYCIMLRCVDRESERDRERERE